MLQHMQQEWGEWIEELFDSQGGTIAASIEVVGNLIVEHWT